MNTKEHLLTIAAEEAVEVAHRISKLLRFGDEVQPGQDLSNSERVMEEFDHLYSAINMLRDRAILPPSIVNRIFEKEEKVLKFLEYSRDRGTLQ